MDDPQRRRSGGRAARQAHRLASHAEYVPFLTRKLAPFEVLGEEASANDTVLVKSVVKSPGHEDVELTYRLHQAGGGWRMPTVPELKTIGQKGQGDPIFRNSGWWVWSGQLRDASSAWGVGVYGSKGSGLPLDNALNKRAFAVRSRR